MATKKKAAATKTPKADPLKSYLRLRAKEHVAEARKYSPGHPSNVNQAKLAELANAAAEAIDGPEPNHYFHPQTVGNSRVKKVKKPETEYVDPNPEDTAEPEAGDE